MTLLPGTSFVVLQRHENIISRSKIVGSVVISNMGKGGRNGGTFQYRRPIMGINHEARRGKKKKRNSPPNEYEMGLNLICTEGRALLLAFLE
jgi:hypothetical protein